eukprot:CAMPEP_0198139438 /NCGR_PEP_ID=MMETSP1443-20131203/2723_1 /TAXON_ID=186043 /ORGANISM="Entomoneis sp., Strain CCMP2396" /LENGTH=178 /DNA_ID=CAMNT_0043801555 /DNA_START=104 /DNA_END=640 /DNA_ORIENTATION=+
MIRAASGVSKLVSAAGVHRRTTSRILLPNYDCSKNEFPSSSSLNSAVVRWHGGPSAANDAATVKVTFLQPEGSPREVEARVGESLLQTAHRYEIDLEGACEGVCACSTCHLILDPDFYDSLPEPSENEEDMLDMAFGLEETSRLGCQITVTKEMDGAQLKMPSATRNFYVDGHKPKPH